MPPSLDIETRSLDPSMVSHAALEPWRVRQGKAEISSIAVSDKGQVTQIVNKGQSTFLQEVRDLLARYKGQVMYAHNAPFDVAFLICSLEPNKFKPVPAEINNIRWRDTGMLVKWVINGQKVEASKFSFSLANLVRTFLPDHPNTAEFLVLKAQKYDPGQNDAYWEERGTWDVIFTELLADKFEALMPPDQRVGFMTECGCIVPVANSWANGIKVNMGLIEAVEKEIKDKMAEAIRALGNVAPEAISSAKQLGNILFSEWGLKPWSLTGKGAPCTAKGDLMWIQWAVNTGSKGYAVNKDIVEKMNHVMSYKTQATRISKYIIGLKDALDHTSDGYIYPVPRLFGTYTGRMTYSSNTFKDGPKVSIAMHQVPRKAKNIRELLTLPEGMLINENDASGQESRLMAMRSGDPTMIKIFNDGLNFHSMTSSNIIGMDYYEFMDNYHEQEETGGYYVEQRQLGKLTNLSCNYRIGGKTLSEKALTQYDTFMTEETGRFLVNTFQKSYPGIPEYWKEAILRARSLGYIDCFGGRRFKIHDWTNMRWASESSAINFPIQGGGAAMKVAAIKEIHDKFGNDAFFMLDLHDATFDAMYEKGGLELSKEIHHALDNLDYSKYWGITPCVPLTYDSAVGKTFKDVK